MNKFIILLLLLISIKSFSQNGYILKIDGNRVYIDLTSSQVKKDDICKVESKMEFFTHPISGDKINKKTEIISQIKVIEVYDTYSVALIQFYTNSGEMNEGLGVSLMTRDERITSGIKPSISVLNIDFIGGVDGGFLGLYMGDLLLNEIFQLDRFRVIDKETLDLQLNKNQPQNDSKNSFRVDYMVLGTAYPPDVVELTTGVPLKKMLGFTEDIVGKKLGSKYLSNVKRKKLKAIVQISLRLVNVKTGEIEFICTEMQSATGENEIGLEGGVLSGLQLKGGATDFLNSISGKATQKVIENLAKYLKMYFNGEIDANNFHGNVVEHVTPMEAIINRQSLIEKNDSIIYFYISSFKSAIFLNDIENKPNKKRILIEGKIKTVIYENILLGCTLDFEWNGSLKGQKVKFYDILLKKISVGTVLELTDKLAQIEYYEDAKTKLLWVDKKKVAKLILDKFSDN